MRVIWPQPEQLPSGHRLFSVEPRRVAIADESGPTPAQTDDGVLWLDFDRPLMIGLHNMIPLVDDGGEQHRTGADAATVLLLAARYGWELDTGDVVYRAQKASYFVAHDPERQFTIAIGIMRERCANAKEAAEHFRQRAADAMEHDDVLEAMDAKAAQKVHEARAEEAGYAIANLQTLCRSVDIELPKEEPSRESIQQAAEPGGD